MRTVFIETLCELASRDDRIWLLTGDLGFSVLERFADAFPDRYVNAGVAEQNMTGVAAGLSSCGKIVFTYSIANFPILRCLEQIRNDVCYHKANVKIVAVGGGYAYGSAGYSHHAVEDIAIMRSLPNMTVFAPGDAFEARLITQTMVEMDGPCYLRLDKAGKRAVYESEPLFSVGKAIKVREGADVTLVSTGAVLGMVVEAAERLADSGISAGVISMPTLKPFDCQAVIEAASRTGRLISVEEHGAGGLGTAISEVLAMNRQTAGFVSLTSGDEVFTCAGSQEHLRGVRGLSVDGIIDAWTKLQ